MLKIKVKNILPIKINLYICQNLKQFIMNIIYLKNEGLGENVKAYNKTNLTSIDIFRNTDIAIQEFEDIEYLEDSLKRDLGIRDSISQWVISDRETFNKASIEFGKLHNSIISEL